MSRWPAVRDLEQHYIPEPNSGCWLWIGATKTDGYGLCYWKGRVRPAHCAVYEHLVGLIPADHDLDHKCRVHCCVNPAHLEPVTRQENIRRGLHGILKKTCRNGHEYAGGNVFVNAAGRRQCRICHRIQSNRSATKRRARLMLISGGKP